MNVTIFAGTTGFDKSDFLKNFTKWCLKKHGYSDNLESADARRFIQYVKFENELLEEDKTSTDIPAFLEKPSFKEKCATIERAFKKIAERIVPHTDHIFLDIHLSYYKRSSFLPPISFANFRQLVPQADIPVKVLTLIDDSFVIWKNLRKREPQYPKTHLRLREILSWRSLETLQAETVALNYTNEARGSVENYLFAVRHPLDTLYNLVFRPRPVCAYLSFPITNTRNLPERVEDINSFRRQAHSLAGKHSAALFDPVTIDELALQAASLNQRENSVVLEKKQRWPLDLDHNFVREPDWPIEIPRQEIEEVLPDINNNIRARDFKLIDNSRFTVAYRPYFGGESGGVREEMSYTISSGKRTFAYYPPEDGGPKTGHPFDQSIVSFPDKNGFLRTIDQSLSATC